MTRRLTSSGSTRCWSDFSDVQPQGTAITRAFFVPIRAKTVGDSHIRPDKVRLYHLIWYFP